MKQKSLARLWAENGERAKALDLLVPLRAAFSEGYEWQPYKEASALVDALR